MWAAGLAAAVLVSCSVAAGSSKLPHLLPPASGLSFSVVATSRFAVGAAAIGGAAALSAVASLPWPVWLPWVGFAALGVWLACVDALTGLVPRPVSLAAGGTIVVLVGAQSLVEGSFEPLVRGVVGGVGVWLLFAGLWVVARGAMGFGDVRFSLPWAMTAAATSWQHLALASLLGSLLALLFGLVARVRQGPGARSFPYTPGLAAGLFLAAVLLSRFIPV